MKLKYCLLALAILSRTNIVIGQERLRRDESFLGIHFDFHAGASDKNIGANTTPKDGRDHPGHGTSRLHPD